MKKKKKKRKIGYIGNFSCDRAIFVEDGKYGIMNLYGNVIVEPRFDYISAYTNGMAVTHETYEKEGVDGEVVKGLLYGVINTNGDWIIVPNVDPIRDIREGMIAVGFTTKRRFYDIKGKWRHEDNSPTILAWGFRDKEGNTVVEPIHDEVGTFHEGFCSIKRMCKKTVPNPQNKSGESTIKLALWGFIDKNGSVVVPCIYDKVLPFYNGRASVVLDGQHIVIDKRGEILEGLK